MKRRNKEYFLEKEFLRLKRDLDTNRDAQYKLGWVELEEPIFIGYTAKLVLRKDVANREDAWVFQHIIDNFGTTTFARKIKDLDFDAKPRSRYVIYSRPKIDEIAEYSFNKLAPQVKKWFHECKVDTWRGKTFSSQVPSFFFEIKLEKTYRTKMRIFDEILEQEEAEIDAKIRSKFYTKRWYSGCGGVPKSFRQQLNKTQRAKAKQALHYLLKGDEVIFEDNYKDAAWRFW